MMHVNNIKKIAIVDVDLYQCSFNFICNITSTYDHFIQHIVQMLLKKRFLEIWPTLSKLQAPEISKNTFSFTGRAGLQYKFNEYGNVFVNYSYFTFKDVKMLPRNNMRFFTAERAQF